MRIVTSELSTGGASIWKLADSLKLEKSTTFGESGRLKYIQKLTRFVKDGVEYLIVGRKGLYLDIYEITSSGSKSVKDTATGRDRDDDNDGGSVDGLKYLKTKKLMTTKTDSDFFITIEVLIGDVDKFRACTGLGYCYFFELDKVIGGKYNDFSMSFGLHGSITFFKFLENVNGGNGTGSDRIIVGGKDRELNIIELENHTNIWKSKSIKRNELDAINGVFNKEPIWIQDILVDDTEDDISIIAATRFGKLLFYNPSLSKFPIDELQIMENPIKHLEKVSKECLVIGDSFDNVLLFNFKKQELVNRFRVKTGALSSLKTLIIDEHRFLMMITSNVDKKLRLYLVKDGFIKMLSCCDIEGIVPEIFLLETDELPPYFTTRGHKRVRTE